MNASVPVVRLNSRATCTLRSSALSWVRPCVRAGDGHGIYRPVLASYWEATSGVDIIPHQIIQTGAHARAAGDIARCPVGRLDEFRTQIGLAVTDE